MVSATGSTPAGQPLSLNRAPEETLRPWITRIGVTSVILPQGQTITCGTLSEQPSMRMIYGARWTAHTADGIRDFSPGDRGLALYFGPCTEMMKLTVHGSFQVASIYFTPGGTQGLGLPAVETTVDRILDMDCYTGEEKPHEQFGPDTDVTLWLDKVEAQLSNQIVSAEPSIPDRLLTEFETLYLTDPGASLDDFADAHGITRRTLERVIGRDCGVSPRFAMRRARALDMAAALLNVASKDEEAEIALRYFDQSHLTREMKKFFDTTPGRLKREIHPLLRITMEIRQSRRLEALERLASNEPRPWRDPDAEPA